ncbi:hypothetical protein NSTC745_04484 [Nostoc sp. DSM 114161]|uniref:hypothetical protein n=1 Tax=Nostoc sp. DSM 114161 TaxID=3440143 RepID=UPI004045746F
MFLFNRFLHSIIRFVIVSVVTMAMVFGWSAIAVETPCLQFYSWMFAIDYTYVSHLGDDIK